MNFGGSHCLDSKSRSNADLTQSIPSGQIEARLSAILEGVCDMRIDRENAIKGNKTLREEIAKKNKTLAADYEALRFSQDCRNQDQERHAREILKMDDEVITLKQQAKKSGTDFAKSWKNSQKQIDQLKTELHDTNSALTLKTAELEAMAVALNSHHAELEARREHPTTHSTTRDVIGENNHLRKELEEARAALLASRTNQQVEQDRIRKAVQGATASKDELIKRLQNDLRDKQRESEQTRQSDTKNIQELFQDKHFLERNAELEEKLSIAAAVTASLEQELEAGRNKTKRIRNAFL